MIDGIALLEHKQGDEEEAQVIWQHSTCRLVGMTRSAPQLGGPS
jgi:hypothetical protein